MQLVPLTTATKQNIQVSLAAGLLPKAAPNLIIGYLLPIDPYCDQVMQRRISTAHKIGGKKQSIDSYQADISAAGIEWSGHGKPASFKA